MKYLASLLIPGLLLAQPALAPADDAVGPFRNSLTVDRTPVDRNAPMLKSYATMLDKVQPSVVTIMTGIIVVVIIIFLIARRHPSIVNRLDDNAVVVVVRGIGFDCLDSFELYTMMVQQLDD